MGCKKGQTNNPSGRPVTLKMCTKLLKFWVTEKHKLHLQSRARIHRCSVPHYLRHLIQEDLLRTTGGDVDMRPFNWLQPRAPVPLLHRVSGGEGGPLAKRTVKLIGKRPHPQKMRPAPTHGVQINPGGTPFDANDPLRRAGMEALKVFENYDRK